MSFQQDAGPVRYSYSLVCLEKVEAVAHLELVWKAFRDW